MSRALTFVLILVIALLATLAACRDQARRQNVAITTTSPSGPLPTPTPFVGPGESVVDCIKKIPFLEADERLGLLRAWKRQPDYQNYRMIEASDFRIPEWVRSERYWPDVERAIGWSHDYGEMSGAYGLTVFVVNRKATFPNWFSVAVLIRRAGNRFDLYWIFQNADLTHFNLGRHSGNVYLIEYRNEDGQTNVCDLQYSPKLKRWACEFYT